MAAFCAIAAHRFTSAGRRSDEYSDAMEELFDVVAVINPALVNYSAQKQAKTICAQLMRLRVGAGWYGRRVPAD